MPPKKKGKKSAGKGSGKGSKASGRESAVSKAEEEVIDELNEEYFILHIQDLERRYKRYQEKIAHLEKENKELLNEKASVSDDKRERIKFLKESLEKRRDEIADLYDRLEGLQQTKDAEKDMFESQFQRIRAEFQEMKDQLSSENNILAAKLAALEEFKRQKEILLDRYSALEKRLEDMRDAQENNLSAVDHKMNLDRDRLKKEMVHRVNHVAADFRKVSNKQMADTTKRLIRENVSIQTQLVKMSEKISEIVQENEDLQMKSRQHRREIRRQERDQETYAKKNSSHLKIIHMLNLKKEKDTRRLEKHEKEDDEILKLEEVTERLSLEAEDLRIHNLMTSEDLEQLRQEHAVQLEQFSHVREQIRDSKERLVEAIMALRDILQHVPLLPTMDTAVLQTPSKSSISAADTMADAEKLLDNLIQSLSREVEEVQEGNSETSSVADARTGASSSLAKSVSLPASRPGTRGPSGVFKSLINSKPQGTEQAKRRQASPGSRSPSKPVPPISTGFGKATPDTEILKRRSRLGYCLPGSLQLVPTADQKIPTQLEKMRSSQRHMEAQTKREKELWNQLIEKQVIFPFGNSFDQPEHEKHTKKASVQTQSVVKAAVLADLKPSLLNQMS